MFDVFSYPAPPVLSSTYVNNTFFAVLNGTLILFFTISQDQPPVLANQITWTFLPLVSANNSELTVINASTSQRYTFSYMDSTLRLRIHPVLLEDEGKYFVSVNNTVGSDEDYVAVNVFSTFMCLGRKYTFMYFFLFTSLSQLVHISLPPLTIPRYMWEKMQSSAVLLHQNHQTI